MTYVVVEKVRYISYLYAIDCLKKTKK